MGYDNDGRDWVMGDGMGWTGWLMMTLVLITCLVLLGGLLYVLVRGSATPVATGRPDTVVDPERNAAEQTLDERLARGEIEVSDYQQRKTALRGS